MLWFIALTFATVQCYYLVSWADNRLFTYLGDDDDGKHLYGYHALTIPSCFFAIGVKILSLAIFIKIWGCYLLSYAL